MFSINIHEAQRSSPQPILWHPSGAWFSMRRERISVRSSHAFAALLCASCLIFSASRLPAQENVLRAGGARIDITPKTPVTLGGYASRKDLSQGVHDPLSARAVVFEQGGKHLVLISTDLRREFQMKDHR